MTASLVAGAIAGIAGLLVFLTVHHFWILPIWFILPLGALLAALGGVAAGWAYHELLAGLPARPWSSMAMGALIALILVPSIVLAEIQSPLFVISSDGEATLPVSTAQAAVIFVAELLVTSMIMGALLGWLVGRTREAALATAVAGLAFALGPGHNIPFLGGTPGMLKGLSILFLVIVVSAVILVEVEWRLRGIVALTES